MSRLGGKKEWGEGEWRVCEEGGYCWVDKGMKGG